MFTINNKAPSSTFKTTETKKIMKLHRRWFRQKKEVSCSSSFCALCFLIDDLDILWFKS
jgi:hypothetical protein